MFATFKMIGLASALSAGVVTAYDLPQLRDNAAPAGKTFYDRVLPSEEIQAPVRLAYAASLPETTGSVKEVRQDGKGDQLKSMDPTCSNQTEHLPRLPRRRERRDDPQAGPHRHDREARRRQHLGPGAGAGDRRREPLAAPLSISAASPRRTDNPNQP
jgi:hypothetical protein